jgi:uncharacterized protein (UPF0335 family)
MSKKTPMKETAADKAVTKAALENSGAMLLDFVEGLEDLDARIAELKDQAAVKYANAKSQGFDKKAIKLVIKRRSMTPEQIKAQGELGLIAETYMQALEAVGVVE